MQVLIVMAGKGSRFVNAGYTIPKPFIKVNGQMIVELTTRSLPFMLHREMLPPFPFVTEYGMTIAMLREHESYVPVLQECYGHFITTKMFDSVTRGGLETAFLSTENMPLDEPLLVLDSDNAYNGKGVMEFFMSRPTYDYGGVCYFEPIDESSKWCFAFPNKENRFGRITELSEKDETALARGGKPMVGVFYFSSVRFFREIASEVLAGNPERGEFYMSQSMKLILNKGMSVYGRNVDTVVPLGTPEDVRKVDNSL